MMTPGWEKRRCLAQAASPGISMWGLDRYGIVCTLGAGQIKIRSVTMLGKALQRWLDNHGLLAIAAAVLGVVLALSVLFVLGGYLVAAR
jgi:hypothetical protein